MRSDSINFSKLSTIILDRDGVINQDSGAYVKSPSEWTAIPGSLEAIAHLKHSGLRVVVATNQSGIRRGLLSLSDLSAIHRKMADQLSSTGAKLDGIFFCPHTSDDNCRCRKPKPGLLEDILNSWNLSPDECLMVGDSKTDIQAAHQAGIHAIGVRSGKPIAPECAIWRETLIFDNLSAASDYVLEERH